MNFLEEGKKVFPLRTVTGGKLIMLVYRSEMWVFYILCSKSDSAKIIGKSNVISLIHYSSCLILLTGFQLPITLDYLVSIWYNVISTHPLKGIGETCFSRSASIDGHSRFSAFVHAESYQWRLEWKIDGDSVFVRKFALLFSKSALLFFRR